MSTQQRGLPWAIRLLCGLLVALSLALAALSAIPVAAVGGFVRCVTSTGAAPPAATASGCGTLYSSLATAVNDANGSSGDLILVFANTGATAAAPTTFTGGITISTSMTITGVGAVAVNGGGPVITVTTGTITLANLAVTGGSNPGGFGGGILVNLPIGNTVNLTFIGGAITGNQSTFGAGLFNTHNGGSDDRNTVTIINSTIAGNTASSQGGGIQANPGTTHIIHSTISGNSAPFGSGIANNSGTVLTVESSIVAGNTDGGNIESAGFIFGLTTPNSVVGDATALGTLGDHGGPTQTVNLTSDYAPYRNAACATNPQTSAPVATDQRDAPRPTGSNCDAGAYEFGATAPAFPVKVTTASLPLGRTNTVYSQPLASTNGTAPYTYSMLSGSLPPNFTLATSGTISGTTTQSGDYPFTVKVTDAAGDANIRALSLAIAAPTTTYYVGTTTDSANPPAATIAQCTNATNTTCSLRDAFIYAMSGTDTILFTAALSSGVHTFTLLNGALYTTTSVTITGAGASSTIVDGNGTDRVLLHQGGTITITGMTLRNGLSNGQGGGAIYETGAALTLNSSVLSGNTGADGGAMIIGGNTTVTLNDTTVSGNTAAGDGPFNGRGGGIRNNGTLNVNRSTFSGNTGQNSGYGGGAIYSEDTLTVTNSTFSGNNASAGSGGAIYSLSRVTVTQTTFSGDSAANGASNEFYTSSSVTLQNTIVNGTCSDPGNNVTSLDYNLASDGGCWSPAQPHDIFNTDPHLGPLQPNGGPTMTLAPDPISAAIDKIPNAGGCNGAGVTTDQRGTARPLPAGGLCDIGAFELPPTLARFGVANFPSPQTAGMAGSVTVTAEDSGGVTSSQYTGTVHFASSDPNATLPGDVNHNYTFTTGANGDNGTHTFTVTLTTAGPQTITVNDVAIPSITGTQSGITINAASGAVLVVSGFPSPRTAGVAGDVTVTVKDAFANIATDYIGTVHFTSSDTQATSISGLPADYHFTSGSGKDNGIHTFAGGVTLKTAGTQNITATDSGAPSITGTQSGIGVTTAAPNKFLVTGYPSPTQVNVSNAFTVIAKDSFGNNASSYSGSVTFTSTDAQAVLPANYTFTPADAGTHLFTATLKTVGPQSITATDGAITGNQPGITVNAAAANSVTANSGTTPQNAVIGHAFAVAPAVTAKDSFNNPVSGVSVTFSAPGSGARGTFSGNSTAATVSTDPSGVATAPAFTAGSVAGSYTVSVTVPGIGTSTPFTLTNLPDAADHFVLSATSSVTAGTSMNLSITATDSGGNTATGYLGTVHVGSDDPQAVLPSDYSFIGTDAGVHTLAVTLNSVDSHSVTVIQTGTPSINGSLSITVNAAAASTITANASSTPQTATVGTAFHTSLAVTVLDGFGNPVAGVSVTFTAPGSAASGSFTSGSTSVRTTNLSGIATATTFTANAAAGGYTVSANRTGSPFTTPASFSLTNSAGAPGSISPTTGSPQSTTVNTDFTTPLSATVRDSGNNLVPGVVVTFVAPGNGSSGTFAGGVFTVNVTTDGSGVATAPTFTANTTATAGTYLVSASAPGVAAPATFSLTNNPGAANILVVSALANPAQAGVAASFTLTARDSFGNTATGYTGKVHFTSTDAQATAPGDHTFLAGELGSHAFSVTFKSIGPQLLTASDSSNGIGGNQPTQVIPGPAASMTVTGYPSPVAVNTSNGFTVIVRDAFGNTASGYLGTVKFSAAGDAQAVLPGDYTFTNADQGAHSFAATFKTVGAQTLTVKDGTVASTIGSQAGITVTASAATHLAVAAPASAQAGTPFSVTVTAKDALNNTVTDYSRTVRLSSGDAQATLPPDYTFVAADNGAHTFSVTLKVAGSQSVTATDLSVTSINGNASVTVSGPTVATIAPISGPAVAGGTTVTITGTNLTGATVAIGGVNCGSVAINGAGTSLTCVTGAHPTAATVDVVVTTATGAATLHSAFTYLPPNVAPLPGVRPGGGSTTGGPPSPLPNGRP